MTGDTEETIDRQPGSVDEKPAPQQPPVDLHKLAEILVDKLRFELTIENERMGT